MDLRDYIREVPDFPEPGIMFKDITPLLKDTNAFRSAVDMFVERCALLDVDTIAGIDARGFLFAAPLAYRLGKPLVPIRKKGKLPYATHRLSYALEYGSDTVEVHTDAISSGQRVFIVDDVLATGGTMAAAVDLVGQIGGSVVGVGVLLELTDLKGSENLKGYDLLSLLKC